MKKLYIVRHAQKEEESETEMTTIEIYHKKVFFAQKRWHKDLHKKIYPIDLIVASLF